MEIYNKLMKIVYDIYNILVDYYNKYFDWKLVEMKYEKFVMDKTLVPHVEEVYKLQRVLVENAEKNVKMIIPFMDIIEIKYPKFFNNHNLFNK